MGDKPKPEYTEFADRLVATAYARRCSKQELQEDTGIGKSAMTSYANATRFPKAGGFLKMTGPIEQICRALKVQPRWLFHGDPEGLPKHLRPVVDEFLALPERERTKRANVLGWRVGPGKPPTRRPSD